MNAEQRAYINSAIRKTIRCTVSRKATWKEFLEENGYTVSDDGEHYTVNGLHLCDGYLYYKGGYVKDFKKKANLIDYVGIIEKMDERWEKNHQPEGNITFRTYKRNAYSWETRTYFTETVIVFENKTIAAYKAHKNNVGHRQWSVNYNKREVEKLMAQLQEAMLRQAKEEARLLDAKRELAKFKREHGMH